jgi:hypothetical protein
MRNTASILLVAAVALGGCVERRIWIDSEPPGALVWLNDRELGRTPVDVAVVHDGIYDLRLEKEGFQPLVTPATAEGPVWDSFPIDFVVELLPVDSKVETHWKFTLRPREEGDAALIERAERMRAGQHRE